MELLQELVQRTAVESLGTTDQDLEDMYPQYPEYSPYGVMVAMMKQGWKEDPRKGHSTEEIDRIWDYVGFPGYTDDVSWCAASLNCCLKLCGYDMSDSVPVARSFASYGKEVKPGDERVGDIVVLAKRGSDWQGHVGFLENMSDSRLKLQLLGGNQSNEVNVSNYYVDNASTYRLLSIRRISDTLKTKDQDIDTLKSWGLV